MKSLQLTILATLVLLSTTLSIAQDVKKADKLYDRMGYQLAIDHYGNSKDISLQQNIRLAESHRLNGQSENAEILYRTIISMDDKPIHYLHFAQALLMNNKTDEAIQNFKIHKSYQSPDAADLRSDNYLKFIQSPEFDKLKNIETTNIESINTDNFDFSPVIIKDGLLFISSRPQEESQHIAALNYSEFGSRNTNKDIWTKKDFNKIYKSSKDEDGNFTKATILSKSLENIFHQGPLHMTPNEDLLYFTSSHTLGDRKTKTDVTAVPLEIYKSILIDGAWSKPVPFVEINTKQHNEAHPTLSKDGKTIIFASDRMGGRGGMDLYISHRKDGSWTTPMNMGDKINTPGNEAFPFLHHSGKLYYSSDGLGGYGGHDIFYTKLDPSGKVITTPINAGAPLNSNKDDFGYVSEDDDQSGYFSSSRSSSLGQDDIFSFIKGDDIKTASEDETTADIANIDSYMNSNSKEEDGSSTTNKGLAHTEADLASLAHNSNATVPTISKDGKTKIFASDRMGGEGGIDLYISHLKNGVWTPPMNMGDQVNTPGDEAFPLLHQNGKLYYSSDGLGGHGGYDIFLTDIAPNGKIITTPINAGKPLNSNKDDFAYLSDLGDQSEYFSSAHNGSIGRDDISSINTADAPKSGSINNTIPSSSNTANSNNSRLEKDHNSSASDRGLENMDSPLKNGNSESNAIVRGTYFTLDKVYYDFDKATLRNESLPELNRLADLLIEFEDLSIEIGSHTDSRGTRAYNRKLSQKRAESVLEFLTNKNIDPHRIKAKGHGEDLLLNQCQNNRKCSEEEHQYNRRTEFKVLNLGDNTNLVYTDNGPLKIHAANSRSNRSFSNTTLKVSDPNRYKNLNTTQLEHINSQLQTSGSLAITVGAYKNPKKKIREMIAIGFDKTTTASINKNGRIKRVYIGSTDDMVVAKGISRSLFEMGIKNDIIALD